MANTGMCRWSVPIPIMLTHSTTLKLKHSMIHPCVLQKWCRRRGISVPVADSFYTVQLILWTQTQHWNLDFSIPEVIQKLGKFRLIGIHIGGYRFQLTKWIWELNQVQIHADCGRNTCLVAGRFLLLKFYDMMISHTKGLQARMACRSSHQTRLSGAL